MESLPAAFQLISAVAVTAALFGIASHGGRALRWLGFVSALLWSPVVAYLFSVRGEVKFPRFGPVIAGYYPSQGVGVVLMSLLLAVVFVSGWLLGFLASRQRTAEGHGRSVLMWLASSGGMLPTAEDPQSAGLVRRLTRRQLTFDIGGAIAFVPFCLLFDLSSAYVVGGRRPQHRPRPDRVRGRRGAAADDAGRGARDRVAGGSAPADDRAQHPDQRHRRADRALRDGRLRRSGRPVRGPDLGRRRRIRRGALPVAERCSLPGLLRSAVVSVHRPRTAVRFPLRGQRDRARALLGARPPHAHLAQRPLLAVRPDGRRDRAEPGRTGCGGRTGAHAHRS